MKKQISFWMLFVLFCPALKATVFSYNVSAIIPDGDLNGYQNSQTLSGLQPYVTDVNITLNVAGGFNGDFYAYLSHNQRIAILLNRVGRSTTSSVGYPDAGFGPDALANSFRLDDQAGNDVHWYRTFAYVVNGSGQLTGQWQPDGRAIDPLSAGSTFSSAPRANTLDVFNGMDPNGLWTLFVADVSPGGEASLLGWGLELTAVPEPSSAILTGFSILAGLLCVARHRTRCAWFKVKQAEA